MRESLRKNFQREQNGCLLDAEMGRSGTFLAGRKDNFYHG